MYSVCDGDAQPFVPLGGTYSVFARPQCNEQKAIPEQRDSDTTSVRLFSSSAKLHEGRGPTHPPRPS